MSELSSISLHAATGQQAPGSGRRYPGAVLAAIFAVLFLALLAAQTIYVHFIHGIPVVGEVDPLRTAARVLFTTGVLLACYPLCASIAKMRSPLAPVADLAIALLNRPALCLWLMLASTVLVLATVWAMRAFPNSGDEYNYLFQAATFQAGRLWNAVPAAGDLFSFKHAFMQDGKWVSQYAPGWAAILTVGNFAGLPFWLINPLLGVVLLYLTYRLALQRAGVVAGSVAAVLLGLTIFFLFNAASYFAHVYVAIFGLLFCAAAEAFRRQPAVRSALIMGAASGVVALNRPFDAVLFCLPYAAAIAWRLRWTHLRLAPLAALSAAPFIAAALAYNHAVTGNALLPVTNWGYPDLKMGILHAVNESGVAMSLTERAQQALSRVYLLAEWTSPVFLILFGSSFVQLWRRRALVPADFVIIVFIVAYITFPGYGGVQYGPRYYFEAYPLMAISCAAALADWMRKDARERAARFAVALLALHVMIAVAAMPAFMRAFRALIDERMDLYDLVARQELHDAVVVVSAPTSRLDLLGPLDLVRNGIDVSGAVIYALPGKDVLARLKALYPTRRIYVYRRDLDAASGRLDPVQ